MTKKNQIQVLVPNEGWTIILRNPLDWESETIIALSSGQGGATAFGILHPSVDQGMKVGQGVAEGYEAKELAPQITKYLSDHKMWWGTSDEELNKAILKGIKKLHMEP